jgi:hypothetical protein
MMGEPTRTELRRVIEEFRSERDAAKGDVLRAVEDRNAALFALSVATRQLEAIAKLADMDANPRERVELLAAISRIAHRPTTALRAVHAEAA